MYVRLRGSLFIMFIERGKLKPAHRGFVSFEGGVFGWTSIIECLHGEADPLPIDA